MKQIFTFFSALVIGASIFAQDIPNPSANNQILPQGSYVIAMDNSLQANDDASASKRFFNLKAYGLVVHLLNNNVKVKRIIKSGKVKDAVDFSATSKMVKPTSGADGSKDYKAGPFVIFAQDLAGVSQLIDNFNNNVGGISGITNTAFKVKVYQTSVSASVDVRYDFTGFKPKAAILDDGGNPDIHANYFELAGVPTTNYEIIPTTNSLLTNCYNFVSEPHNDKPTSVDGQNVRRFLMAGGNFLAQCKAVETFENMEHFQSASGNIIVQNDDVSVVEFPNADLTYSQFEGPFTMKQGGAVCNWSFTASMINNGYLSVKGKNSANVEVVTASVSKLLPQNQVGGLVFYLGNHKYDGIDDYDNINGIRLYLNALLTPGRNASYMTENVNYKATGELEVNISAGPTSGYPVTFDVYYDDGSKPGAVDGGDVFVQQLTVTQQGVAGTQRLTIPMGNRSKNLVIKVSSGIGCPEEVVANAQIILPISLNTFNAKRNHTMVNVAWETVSEENSLGFNLQRLLGSGVWETIAFVPSRAAGGNSNAALQYSYTDANSFKGVSQYRLQQVDNAGKQKLSDIRAVKGEAQNSSLLLYPNPSTNGQVNLIFEDGSTRDIHVFDFSGRLVKEYKNITNNNFTITNLKSGIYSVQVKDRINGSAAVEKLMVK